MARNVITAVSLALALSVGLAGMAEAGPRGGSTGYVYESERKSRTPEHGYSGFIWGGRRSHYCDYQRIPNRKCRETRSGRKRCWVESWTIRQYCY